MTAPNIDMIAASLRNCSLGARSGSPPSPSPPAPRRILEGSDESEGVTVELNSEMALPYNWEQCLDMRTGQVYYINWEDGTRTTVDPRTTTTFQSTYYYSDDEDEEDDDDDDDDEDDDDDDESSDEENAGHYTLSSSPPAESSSSDSATAAAGISGEILVAVGCKSCFMYFMVPKRVDWCPKCGGHLLRLGRNGCV